MNEPKYYVINGIETWKITAHLPAFRAMAIKYILRAGNKPGETEDSDIQKAMDCLLKHTMHTKGMNAETTRSDL